MTQALAAFSIGLCGAGLAWCWFDGLRLWVLGGVGLLGTLGLSLYGVGCLFLPRRPVEAVGWMGALWLVPFAAAVAASAAGIALAAAFDAPEHWTIEQKKLLAAVGGALTALLAPLLTGGEEKGGLQSWVGRRIKRRLQHSYDSKTGEVRFPQNSEAEQAVFSDPWRGLAGWGPKARLERARAIQAGISALPKP